MAEVLVFCSKAMRTDAFGDIGVEDINLRHPRTHATGWMNWQIRFPVDLQVIEDRKRQAAEDEIREWNMVRFRREGGITRSVLLRDLSFA